MALNCCPQITLGQLAACRRLAQPVEIDGLAETAAYTYDIVEVSDEPLLMDGQGNPGVGMKPGTCETGHQYRMAYPIRAYRWALALPAFSDSDTH